MTPTNICPRCGGTIDKYTLECKYCGTSFKNNNETECVAYANDIPMTTLNDPYINLNFEEMRKKCLEDIQKSLVN